MTIRLSIWNLEYENKVNEKCFEGINLYGSSFLNGMMDLEIVWPEQHATIFKNVIRSILIDFG